METIETNYTDLFPDLEMKNGIITRFTAAEVEYNALIYGVGLRIFASNIILLSGKDVKDFLHRISTNEINSIKENQYTTTLFTNEKGRIIDKCLFLNLGEHFYLIGHKDELNLLQKWIDRYIISEDVKIDNISERKTVFEIIGPQSESYLTLFCGNCIDSLDFDNIIDIEIENSNAKLFKTKHNSNLTRYMLITDKENEKRVLRNFVSQNSVFDFAPIGEQVYKTYCVEKGIPNYPSEINDNFNPHEANIIEHVSETKGCYIGQEVIARLDTYDKVQRELKHFIFKDDFDYNGQAHSIETSDGNNLGVITSVVRSPKYNGLLGLGYARRKYIEKLKDGKVNINGKDVRFALKDIEK